MENLCKTCVHYGFYRMITEGMYGYSGHIPCANCKHFSWVQDCYVKAIEVTEVKTPVCPVHTDGHHFIACDDLPPTCHCGKQEGRPDDE